MAASECILQINKITSYLKNYRKVHIIINNYIRDMNTFHLILKKQHEVLL